MIRSQLARELADRSLAAVGRELGVSASTLASVITGTARAGSKVHVAVRWIELMEERARLREGSRW